MNFKKFADSLINQKQRAYEINSRHCSLNIYDSVTPETVIGFHYKTSRLIRAERFGKIATMYYNPVHDSLVVVIALRSARSLSESIDSSGEEERLHIPGLYIG